MRSCCSVPSAKRISSGAPGTCEHLLRLARVQVPRTTVSAETLHRLRVLQHLAEVHHVVVPAGEGRGQHDVATGKGPDVVAVAVDGLLYLGAIGISLRGHPVGGDVLALVGVLDERGPSAMVLAVRQCR